MTNINTLMTDELGRMLNSLQREAEQLDAMSGRMEDSGDNATAALLLAATHLGRCIRYSSHKLSFNLGLALDRIGRG